jgi:hypothetical protein
MGCWPLELLPSLTLSSTSVAALPGSVPAAGELAGSDGTASREGMPQTLCHTEL